MADRREIEMFLLGAAAMLGLTAVADPRAARRTEEHSSASVPEGAHPTRRARGPGRDAQTPAQIPARGWWSVLKRVYGKMNDDRALAEAAGVTFYALLALFPALAALVSLYGLFADPATIEKNLQDLSGVLPGGGMQIIGEQVHSLASNSHSALGIGLIIGLLTSLWSANSGIKALFDALNVVYEEHEKRSYLRRLLISFAFTLGMILFLIAALVGTVALPAILDTVGLGGPGGLLLRLARWPLLLVVVAFVLSLVYRFGPSRTQPQWRWVSWGGMSAAILWVIVSAAFSWYAANFGSYNKTYGSLGAAIGFMTWIWISTTVVLLGAELNAELEHQTARDTTVGADRPLGMRGATKADTVAATS